MFDISCLLNLSPFLLDIYKFDTSLNILQFVLTITIFFTIIFVTSFSLKRLIVILYNILFYAGFVLSIIFNMNLLVFTFGAIILFGNVIFCFVNSGSIRKYVAKNLKNEKIKTNGVASKKVDYEKFIKDMVTTIDWLSENKVGALITIERKTPLDDFIKSGTLLSSTFTPELVESIFYEGTRLHDGALIIRDAQIIAAAVYYPPSNNTFLGKFGARHRAAIGISEVTDSITIIVSEETGRVAIAHSGVMDNIKLSEFADVFRNQIINS